MLVRQRTHQISGCANVYVYEKVMCMYVYASVCMHARDHVCEGASWIVCICMCVCVHTCTPNVCVCLAWVCDTPIVLMDECPKCSQGPLHLEQPVGQNFGMCFQNFDYMYICIYIYIYIYIYINILKKLVTM